MNNYAGRADKDEKIKEELVLAGIEPYTMPEDYRAVHPEMRTIIVGHLGPWTFRRNWYYWAAEGPGIPPTYADALHEKYGKEVRVAGHCGCFAVGNYHVDTQEGLRALADTIRLVMSDAETRAAGGAK